VYINQRRKIIENGDKYEYVLFAKKIPEKRNPIHMIKLNKFMKVFIAIF
jgi:hypothetical protein